MKDAAQKFLTDNKLTFVESQNVQVNGLPAIAMISDQLPQNANQQGAAQQQSVATTGTQSSSQDPNKSSGSGESKTQKGGTTPTKSSGGKTSKTGSGTVSTGKTGSSGSSPTPNTPTRQSPTGQNQNPVPGQGQTNPGVKPELRIMTYLIQYNNMIYMMHGLTKFDDFRGYSNAFLQTMKSFRTLTDQSKIDVKPERIFIKTVQQSGTLRAALKSYRMPTNKHEKLALLNGMELDDPVQKGTLIKTLGK